MFGGERGESVSLLRAWRGREGMSVGRGGRGCGRSRRGVDVCRAREEDVRLHVDEVRAPPPNILSVVDDGDHAVPTGEYRPGWRRWKGTLH